jgi:hypothetical protein
MKNWRRLFLLVIAITMASLAHVSAWPYENGSCYIICDGGQYPVPADSSWDCCTQTHLCPDNSYPLGTVWEPDEGWPLFCPPYAD